MSVSKARGFTIFEMMVTVAIAALVSAFAIPAFQDVMSRSRINAVAEELSNSLQMARNTAISRRRTVVLLRDTTVNFPKWELRLDTSTGELIDSHQIPGNIRLTTFNTAAPPVAVVLTQIEFRPSGYAAPTPAATPSLAMIICDNSTKKDLGRTIELSPVGRMRAFVNPSTATCNP